MNVASIHYDSTTTTLNHEDKSEVAKTTHFKLQNSLKRTREAFKCSLMLEQLQAS
jgi:hypothetical protein